MNQASRISNFRPATDIMTAERLGAFRVTSLSFTKNLIRRLHKENWIIEKDRFDLNKEGYGIVTYIIKAYERIFTFIAISTKIADENRSDRVIAEEWDVTFALCDGVLGEEKINRMNQELPRQEAGRGDSKDFVWSRANKSGRVFSYVVDCLIEGKQPDFQVLNKVGYLFRTTAVYGNGKFGLAQYEKIKENHPFSGPYQAQMFAVYMLRQFSFDLVEHIAKGKSEGAVRLDKQVKRFIGTGNATGLGMVPFLVSHPKLLHQWVFVREKAIERVLKIRLTKEDYEDFLDLLEKTMIYFHESTVAVSKPFIEPKDLSEECVHLKAYMEKELDVEAFLKEEYSWLNVIENKQLALSTEMKELINTLLLEVYEERVADLENLLNVDETYEVIPEMKVSELIHLIETNYAWALTYDFAKPQEKHYFWYSSLEKEEPRMGIVGIDEGSEKAVELNIAEQTQQLYKTLKKVPQDEFVSSFLLRNSIYKGIVKRIQSLKDLQYAEIQSNILSENFLPIHLLRCKLAIFGAERFDPKSNRWVRITLFQGAPLLEDLGREKYDSWLFPNIPKAGDTR